MLCVKKSLPYLVKKYNVKTEFVHGGTETIFGKIKAEKDNPQADFWYGGTIEPHFQAGELGLLEAYRSPKQAEILPQFKSLMEQKGEFTSVAYILVLGFGVNTQKLAQLGLPTPKPGKICSNRNTKAKFNCLIHELPAPLTPLWRR